MYIVIMAWLYVALMMAVAEANHPYGSLLGALATFLMYGLAPMALAVYLLRTPHRRRAARERERQAQSPPAPEPSPAPATSATQPDDRSHATRAAIPPEREEV